MWYCSVGVVSEISNMYATYVLHICSTYVAYMFEISVTTPTLQYHIYDKYRFFCSVIASYVAIIMWEILEWENFGMKNEIWQLEAHFLFKPTVLMHWSQAGTPAWFPQHVCVCVVHVCVYVCIYRVYVYAHVCICVCVSVCVAMCVYICVCVCVRVYVCVCVATCVYMCVYIRILCVYVCICLCVCMCMCMYVCVVYVCMYVFLNTHGSVVYVYVYVCVSVCVCVCMCV